MKSRNAGDVLLQLSGEEMITEYRESDLLVFASTYEGFACRLRRLRLSGCR
jgi:hypothetical protein